MLHAAEPCHVPWRLDLDKLMKAEGLDLLLQMVQARLFPQRTAEARELLKQGMRVGGPMSRLPGEPMTSHISRHRRWWTLVREMDNTLELVDTVQGSMMLEQGGLSRFEQNMVLTHTRGQRTMTAIGRSLARTALRRAPSWARDTRAYRQFIFLQSLATSVTLAVPTWQRPEHIKESTDTAVYGEEGMPDDCNGEQDEPAVGRGNHGLRGSGSAARAKARGSQGQRQRTKAAICLWRSARTERDDIHHLSGTIESWELPGDGPFLFPLKDMAKSRILIENKPGFNLRMYKDAKTGLMLINMADFDLLNDQDTDDSAVAGIQAHVRLASDYPASDQYHCAERLLAESPVNILRSLAPMVGHLDSTSWTSIPSPMAIFAVTTVSDIVGRARDFSLGDREDRQMLAKTLRRRFPEEARRTDIILLVCRAFRDPAGSAPRNHWGVHPTRSPRS